MFQLILYPGRDRKLRHSCRFTDPQEVGRVAASAAAPSDLGAHAGGQADACSLMFDVQDVRAALTSDVPTTEGEGPPACSHTLCAVPTLEV